ncbi:SDR family oxidoreductase [Acuticoccus sediminis]|uniref:SDR family oxidoreductase n=1 Tax=Acuticoccus sediminis TaxID=2184697 RepID=UPI001CFD5218|nr:SDR family oxidoreductase [Acuticoccus sediminis]
MSRTVLITGTSSGFGEAAVRRFASEGWNVVATMRQPDAGQTLAALENVLVTRLDVQDRESIEMAVTAGLDRFGRLDVVVNNAGYGLFGIFEGASREAIQNQFDVNLFGVMDVTRAILPHFRANRAGTIINVSSGAGVFGAPMASIYSASKFALEGFSEGLWYELHSLGIDVKLIEPGGAPSTGFVARMGAEGAAIETADDYRPFLDKIDAVYAGMGTAADPDAVEKVVGAIVEAATDGSHRLRYAPTADIQPILEARRRSSEEGYQALVRSFFVPLG